MRQTIRAAARRSRTVFVIVSSRGGGRAMLRHRKNGELTTFANRSNLTASVPAEMANRKVAATMQEIAIIAGQRAGTTVFQRALAETPDFHTFGEIFEPGQRFDRYRRTNPLALYRWHRRTRKDSMLVFQNCIKWLSRQTTKPFFLIDFKHDQLRYMDVGKIRLSHPPLLLIWLMAHGTKIVLMRRNPKNQAISSLYSIAAGFSHISEFGEARKIPGATNGDRERPVVRLDPDEVRCRANLIEADCRLIDGWLDNYEEKILLQYESLFVDGALSAAALDSLSSLIGKPITSPKGLPLRKVIDDPGRLISNYHQL